MTSPEGIPPPSRMRIAVAYICVFVFWGSTYLAIRIGVATIPPALLSGIRFLLAGSALLIAGAARKLAWPARTDFTRLCIVGVFLFVGGNGLVAWAEQWVPSGLAALLIATVPLFMSSIDALVPGGHRLPPAGWLGIIVGLAGVALLVFPGRTTGTGDDVSITGVAGLTVASLSWSVGSMYSKRKPAQGHLVLCIGIEMLAGGVVLVGVGFLSGEFAKFHGTFAGMAAILYLAIMGSIVGFSAYTYLLRHVPAAKASMYAYVNPVVAVCLGAIVLAEPIDARMAVAAAVILGGVALVQVAQSRSA